MSLIQCPKCAGKLKVPGKRQGAPVVCPVCEHRFLPKPGDAVVESDSKAASNSTDSKAADSKNSKPAKPTMRSLPMPAGVPMAKESAEKKSGAKAQEKAATKKAVAEKTTGAKAAASQTRLDSLMPPGKSSSPSKPDENAAPKRSSISDATPPPRKVMERESADDFVDAQPESDSSLPTPRSTAKLTPKPTAIPTPRPTAIPEPPPAAEAKSKAVKSAQDKPEPHRAVARIIRTESIEPQLTQDGKLPTLHLNDDDKQPKEKVELERRPVLVGLVICISLISSGLLLFVASQTPTKAKTKVQAREDLRRFYEVGEGVSLKPYQLELREAQRAYTRNDRKREIAAYRKVMGRVRSEGLDENGLTGVQSWNDELETLLSILLSGEK